MLNFLNVLYVHLINCLHFSSLVPPQEERPLDLQPAPLSELYYKPPSHLFVLLHRSCFIIWSAEHVSYSAVFISHNDIYVPFAFTITNCPVLQFQSNMVPFILQPCKKITLFDVQYKYVQIIVCILLMSKIKTPSQLFPLSKEWCWWEWRCSEPRLWCKWWF